MAVVERSPSLQCIGIRMGSLLVDQVIFCFDDNTQLVWGHTGGNPPRKWPLNKGEYLAQVNVSQGNFLDSIQFVTNKGRQSPWFGGSGGSPDSFKAAQDCEIVCLLMKRYRCESYTFAKGSIAGVCNRRLGGVTPPLYMPVGLNIMQLDPNCDPSTGYYYDNKPLDEIEMFVSLTKKEVDKVLEVSKLSVEDINRLLVKDSIPIVAKQAFGDVITKIMAKDLSSLTGQSSLPEGIVEHLRHAPSQGFTNTLSLLFKEMIQQNSVIQSNIANVLQSHILGDQQTSKTPNLDVGAGLKLGGPSGFAIGLLLAPLAITSVSSEVSESASAVLERWKRDQMNFYREVTKPLDELLVVKGNVKCPNGHNLVDVGQTTLRFVNDQSNFVNESCKIAFEVCMCRHELAQFQAIRFFCAYCAVCYCEPCMLKLLNSEQPACPATVLWT